MSVENGDAENAVNEVIEHPNVATQANLARLLGISAPTVSEWVSGKRPVPHLRAAQMEALVDGAVSKKRLCPNYPWHLFEPTQAA